MSHPLQRRELLSSEQLERSDVVANCRMNRERTLTGGNGYTRELGFNPLDVLEGIIQSKGQARWLDLCCGTGSALMEAAQYLQEKSISKVEIVGVDLVNMFKARTQKCGSLRLIEASLTNWRPDDTFDLITCVHGLHYIGDKLDLVTRAISWLAPQGIFSANLSLENIQLQGDRSAARIVAAELRKNGVTYDSRRKRVSRQGFAKIQLPFRYQGADDSPGPNYTGQPSVNSHYEFTGSHRP